LHPVFNANVGERDSLGGAVVVVVGWSASSVIFFPLFGRYFAFQEFGNIGNVNDSVFGGWSQDAITGGLPLLHELPGTFVAERG
jgi:hypothetical protein